MFNREYIFNPDPFSSIFLLLVYQSVHNNGSLSDKKHPHDLEATECPKALQQQSASFRWAAGHRGYPHSAPQVSIMDGRMAIRKE